MWKWSTGVIFKHQQALPKALAFLNGSNGSPSSHNTPRRNFNFENERMNDYLWFINCCPLQMFTWSLYLWLNLNEIAYPSASLSQPIFPDHDWWESLFIYFHLNSLTLNYAGVGKHLHYWKDTKHWLVHPQNV